MYQFLCDFCQKFQEKYPFQDYIKNNLNYTAIQLGPIGNIYTTVNANILSHVFVCMFSSQYIDWDSFR
jgi:hypothetical protein